MRKLVVIVLLAVVVAGGWWFWSSSRGSGGIQATLAGADATAPLAFVPADTPYVFASIEPFPKAVTDPWMQQLDGMGKIWQAQLGLVIARLGADEPESEQIKWLRAFDAELRDKSLSQVFDAIGYSMQSRFAVYGIGVVPVMRLSLADPAAFRAFVVRIEERSGEKLPVASIDGVDYWQFTDPTAKLRAIMALQGTHLVLTVAPVGDDGALRTLLGIELPATTMRDAAALIALNKTAGYLPQASGYVDTVRLVALLTAPATPTESAFLAALDVQKPVVDAVCQAEFAALAAIAPRLSMGYTELGPKASTAVSRIELRSDVAKDLMTLRAPMPGLAAADDAAFNFGLSLAVGAVPSVVGKWTASVSTSPWKCSSLLELNTAAADVGQQAANPMLFAVAPVFNGFHAILSRVDVKSLDTAPDLAGKLVIGSPNPAALIGMAQSFAPQIAQAKLTADGDVHPLPAIEGLPPGLPAFAAMTDRLLGIAVGAGEDATLLAAMKTDGDDQPLVVFGYSGAAFAQFSDRMQEAALALEDPALRAESEQSAKLMRDVYAMIKRAEFRLDFTENGIEMRQSATMN